MNNIFNIMIIDNLYSSEDLIQEIDAIKMFLLSSSNECEL